MTRKEALKMDSLVDENAKLRDQISRHMSIYGDCLCDIIALKSRIETMREVMAWPIGVE